MIPHARSICAIFVVFMAVFGLFNVPPAAAGGDEDRLIREGVESRRKHKDLEALESFRKAYDLNHSPRAAAQMGLAEVALGRWVEAAGHLEEAMARSSDPWVAKNLATLNESYGRVRQRVGELEILGGPPQATIAVEGAVVGTLPLAKPLRVRSGDCRFVVTAPGYESVSRTVDVAAGQLTRETVNLAKVASSSQSNSEVSGTARPVAVDSDQGHVAAGENEVGNGASVATNNAQATNGATSSNHLPTVGIVLASAGLVAVGAGVVFSVKTHAAGQDAAKNPTFDPSADSTGRRYQTLQYVAYGVGAALIAAGVTTYVLGSDRDNGRNQPQLALVPWSDGGAMMLSGRF